MVNRFGWENESKPLLFIYLRWVHRQPDTYNKLMLLHLTAGFMLHSVVCLCWSRSMVHWIVGLSGMFVMFPHHLPSIVNLWVINKVASLISLTSFLPIYCDKNQGLFLSIFTINKSWKWWLFWRHMKWFDWPETIYEYPDCRVLETF